MSGGVRNLRAMFETKDPADPPDRGRSPGASSFGGTSSCTSPRPLSMVRTSFVAVGGSGQVGLGLKRDASGEPSMTRRRTSFSIDETDNPKATAERKQSMATEFDARKRSAFVDETIPETAVETPGIELDRQLGHGSGLIKTNMKPVVPKEKKADPPTHTKGNSISTIAKTVEKPASKTTRPAPIATARTSATLKASPTKGSKSPLPKTPTTPSRREAPRKVAEKKVEPKVEKKPSRATMATSHISKPRSTSRAPAASSAAVNKTRISTSPPPQTGFKKPRPRSPTKPIKLPSSLTAHTASSGSKTTNSPPPPARQTLSRASGNAQHTNALHARQSASRSPSRASTVSKPSSATRKSNLSSSGRPSLGPPPANRPASRQSLPHQPAPGDDSFLARMMRPTTSSAGKTAAQPATPPTKAPIVHKVARDGPPPKMASMAAKPKEVVKHVAKTAKAVEKKVEAVVPVPKAKEEPKSVTKDSAPEPKVEIPEVKEKVAETLAAEPSPVAPIESVNNEEKAEAEEPKATEPEIAEPEQPEVVEEPVVLETAQEEPALKVAEDESAPAELIPSAVEEEVSVPEPVEEESAVEEVSVPEPVEEEIVPEQVEEEKEPENEPEVVEKEVPIATEIEEPVIEEAEVTEKEPESTPIAEPTKEDEPTIISTPKVEPALKSPVFEDPADVKAREEIELLNAQVMMASQGEDFY
ncbi:hypothetical protein LOCC1_G006316 [Lachnellula occidentalis]|uniref:Uncharacterized protein n=1 Tax=Lachnellula occidentalis TaxID=215460 RepID=A0A8H8S693_9HELO|nr:hypothetical protein LOCC1_G006316 [Lachnellula occidentalis]